MVFGFAVGDDGVGVERLELGMLPPIYERRSCDPLREGHSSESRTR